MFNHGSRRNLWLSIINGCRSATIREVCGLYKRDSLSLGTHGRHSRTHEVLHVYLLPDSLFRLSSSLVLSGSKHTLARGHTLQYDVLISRNHVKANLRQGENGSLRNSYRCPANDEGSNSRERVLAKGTAVEQQSRNLSPKLF